MGGNGTAIGVFFLYDEMMIYRGVCNINNYNYKKLRIIQSYPQPSYNKFVASKNLVANFSFCV